MRPLLLGESPTRKISRNNSRGIPQGNYPLSYTAAGGPSTSSSSSRSSSSTHARQKVARNNTKWFINFSIAARLRMLHGIEGADVFKLNFDKMKLRKNLLSWPSKFNYTRSCEHWKEIRLQDLLVLFRWCDAMGGRGVPKSSLIFGTLLSISSTYCFWLFT